MDNEMVLENIFEEVLEEYSHDFNRGDITEDDLHRITRQRFEDSAL